MSFVLRLVLYTACLFLVMLVYTGQRHETAAETVSSASRATVKVLVWSAVGIAIMFGLEFLFVD